MLNVLLCSYKTYKRLNSIFQIDVFEVLGLRLNCCAFADDLSGLKTTYGYNGNWRNWNNNFFFKTDTWFVGHEVKVGWEPESFIYCNNSANPGTNNDPTPLNTLDGTNNWHVVNGKLRFKNTDRIQIEVGSGNNASIGWMNNSSSYQDYTATWTIIGGTGNVAITGPVNDWTGGEPQYTSQKRNCALIVFTS